MIERELSLETLVDKQAVELNKLFDEHKSERIVVLGGTCTGKSTLVEHIAGAHDMDKLVFPLLTKEEADYVCQTPWTPELGETMSRLTKERVTVQPGKPVFGTVVLDADLIVQLKISDDSLKQRTKARGASFTDAKNMQQQIEDEILASSLPVIEFDVD
jgi:energy-coupling factor transporter ATP-binding protein EcfA2